MAGLLVELFLTACIGRSFVDDGVALGIWSWTVAQTPIAVVEQGRVVGAPGASLSVALPVDLIAK
jgi:hypothetical protein